MMRPVEMVWRAVHSIMSCIEQLSGIFMTSIYLNSMRNTFASLILLGLASMQVLIAQAPNWSVWNIGNSILSDNRVYFIEIDQVSGSKYIGTFSGGLYTIQSNQWTRYTTSSSQIPSNKIKECRLDAQGSLWIATEDGGVSKFSSGTFTNYSPSNSGLPGWEAWAITPDGNGGAWIGNGMDGLVHFDGGSSWITYNSGNSGLPFNWVNSIIVDTNGDLWIATGGGGIARKQGNNWTVWNTLNSNFPSDYCYTVFQASNGDIWVGSQFGASRFNGTGWDNYNSSNSGFSGLWCSSFAEDQAGRMWMGSNDEGILLYDGSNWTQYKMANSTLPDDYVETIAVSPAGMVWVGTFAGGVAGAELDTLINSGVASSNCDQPLIGPNPCTHRFRVEMPISGDDEFSFQIIDTGGRAVAGGRIVGVNTEIDVTGLRSGEYLLRIWGTKTSWAHYIILQN